MIFQNYFQAAEPPSKSLVSCYKYSTDENDFYPLHCHSYYEISYIFNGERYEWYNGKKYKVSDNSLFFVPPLAIHGNDNITRVNDAVIQLSTSFLCVLSSLIKPDMKLSLNSDKPFIVLQENSPAYNAMKKLGENSDDFNAMYAETGFDDFRRSAVIEYRRNSLVLELIAALLESGCASIGSGGCNFSKIIALDRVINCILDHPDNVPDMNTAARISGMSYYNFSRLFKDATGMNYSECCNLVRIRHAEELLLKTDKSISEISLKIGIDTPSYFTRLFHQINGFSPAEYRKLFKDK